MFERYSESTRRALFFARYEASQLGGRAIETEHLLLALTRNTEPLMTRIFGLADMTPDALRQEITGRAPLREKVSTSGEHPFSAETQRVLDFAAEEADRMQQTHIGPEHLLLALLREETTVAAAALAKHGVRLDTVRTTVAELHTESKGSAHVSELVEEIQRLFEDLAQMPIGSLELQGAIERIRWLLGTLKERVAS
jgi:ATP-dependent Clp protease ATP-binding subunit ClpC